MRMLSTITAIQIKDPTTSATILPAMPRNNVEGKTRAVLPNYSNSHLLQLATPEICLSLILLDGLKKHFHSLSKRKHFKC